MTTVNIQAGDEADTAESSKHVPFNNQAMVEEVSSRATDRDGR